MSARVLGGLTLTALFFTVVGCRLAEDVPSTQTQTQTQTADGPSITLTPAGGDPPARADVCDLLRDAIELSNPFTRPVGARWIPGGSILVGATLRNLRGEDFLQYVGIRVVADHPAVIAPVSETVAFAILGGASQTLEIGFRADPDLPAGTAVRFRISMTTVDRECPSSEHLEVTAIVE